MSIAQDMYNEDVYVKNIDVTKLDEKISRKHFIKSTVIGILFTPLLAAVFFYVSMTSVFPSVIASKIILTISCLIFCFVFLAHFISFWRYLVCLFIFAIICAICSIALVIYCDGVIIFSPQSSNEVGTLIGVSAPWSWIVVLLLVATYIWLNVRIWRKGTRVALEKLARSRCIDEKRALYFEDLEDRDPEEEIKKPQAFDVIGIAIGTLLMPFIQVWIIKSNSNTPTSAIIFFLILYILSIALMVCANSFIFRALAMKKVQEQLGLRLKAVRARGIKFKITLFRR